MSTPDFFRNRIDLMIDLKHPLAVLAKRLPWAQIEAALAPKFARQDRAGVVVEGVDMLGPTLTVAGAGRSNAGRPRLPMRLLISLVYLKHSFNLSDEELCERWSENVLWQFFSGQEYYEHRLPCDATQIGRFRRDIGEDGLEQLLKATIDAAAAMKVVKPADFQRVTVDTTVQEKAIAHPVDSRLLEIARHKVVAAAKRVGMTLKQTFAKQGKKRRRDAAQGDLAQQPAHDPGHRDARDRSQAQGARVCRRERSGDNRAGHADDARRAHPHAAHARQEQAVRAARAGGRVHRQG